VGGDSCNLPGAFCPRQRLNPRKGKGEATRESSAAGEGEKNTRSRKREKKLLLPGGKPTPIMPKKRGLEERRRNTFSFVRKGNRSSPTLQPQEGEEKALQPRGEARSRTRWKTNERKKCKKR